MSGPNPPTETHLGTTQPGDQSQTPSPPSDTTPSPPTEAQHFADAFDNPDLRNNPAIRKFTDPASLASSYVELEKKIGQRGLVVPQEGADPATVRAAMKELGCPESPDQYPVSAELPEGMQLDEGFLARMRQRAWDSGLTAKQWEQQFGHFVEYQKEQYNEALEAHRAAMAESEAKLRDEWGAAFESKQKQAVEAAKALFGEEATQIIGLQIGEGKVLGNHPAFVKALALLGEKLSESGLVQGVSDVTIPTKEQAQRELDAMMADPEVIDALHNPNHLRHKEVVQKRETLYRSIYPNERQTGLSGGTAGGIVG